MTNTITAKQIIEILEDAEWRQRVVTETCPAKTQREQMKRRAEVRGWQNAIDYAKNQLKRLEAEAAEVAHV